MKEVLIKNCKECPGCVITPTQGFCYPYWFINNEYIELDLEMLEDVPEKCPLSNGIIMKLDFDPDGIDDTNEFEPDIL
jgi:hypothetical protein